VAGPLHHAAGRRPDRPSPRPSTLTGTYPASEIPLALATLAVSVPAIVGYLYVGRRLSQREVSSERRLASWQFSLWWVGLGIALAIGRVELALAVANGLSYASALTFSIVNVGIECAYLWGLVGWVLYVVAGRYYLAGLTVFYAAVYVVLVYAVLVQMPFAVSVSSGIQAIQYASPESSGTALALQLLTLLPEVVGAGLYLSLLYGARDRSVRFRTVLVGSSILLWVAIHAFVPSSTIGWVLWKTALEVLPAFLSLVGVIPPLWIRRKLGFEGTAGGSGANAAAAEPLPARPEGRPP
jgi:hypothetical protein